MEQVRVSRYPALWYLTVKLRLTDCRNLAYNAGCRGVYNEEPPLFWTDHCRKYETTLPILKWLIASFYSTSDNRYVKNKIFYVNLKKVGLFVTHPLPEMKIRGQKKWPSYVMSAQNSNKVVIEPFCGGGTCRHRWRKTWQRTGQNFI